MKIDRSYFPIFHLEAARKNYIQAAKLCKEGLEESHKALELGVEEMSSLVLPSEMDELQEDMTKIALHMSYCLDVLDEVEGRLTHLNVYFN